MNTQALQRITNPDPLPRTASGERLLVTHEKARTTAKLKAEIEARKLAADPDAKLRGWLGEIAGQPV